MPSDRNRPYLRPYPEGDPSSLPSHERITEFVVQARSWQADRLAGVTRRLPLAVAEPDVLLERAVALAEPDGIPDAELRRVVPVAKQRYERGLWRLQEAGIVARSKERRPDAAGRDRDLRVWRLADAVSDGVTGEEA